MGFGEAIAICFGKYVDFRGRAKRPEYWFWALFTALVSLVAQIFDLILFGPRLGIISTVTSLGLLLPGLAVSARRLHDIDRTGWWLLISLVPVIGVIVLLVFFCLRGTPGGNRFGSDP
jgi:uncharacterized membrane protein YhaH (DUF805 family)